MLEKHPFGDFVPENTRRVLLGSFVTKPQPGYEWFFANGRNQFWPIMEQVYGLELKTTENQKKLFRMLGMALSDIILECERVNNSHLDVNLKNLVINPAVRDIVVNNNLERIFFSSRFAETLYRRHFGDLVRDLPQVRLVILPSPSPRYTMSITEKIAVYKKLLPGLE